jgi:hypothetical protein
MKKILILIAAFLMVIQFSNAQTAAATQNLGFNLGFYSNRSDNVYINPADFSRQTYVARFSILNLGPAYNYFIKNNVDIGATLIYSSYLTSYSGDLNGRLKQSNNDFGGTIFIRKYVLYENKIGFRTGPYLGYDRGTQKVTNIPSQNTSDLNSSTNNYSAGLRFDLVYYPLKRVGFSATLANLMYTNYKSDNITQGSSSGNSFNLNLVTSGLQVSAFYIF